MFRLVLIVGIALHSATGAVADEQILNGHTFTLPDGFEIELAAVSPLVDRPITADFDELGRLYVSDSSGSNDNVQKQLEDRTHRIVRLEDSDGDGRFDKSVVFADKMMFPEGTLWYDGSLYVAAPPSIWKLTDTNGDGVADERQEWFAGKTLTGCANDLHGPYLGPDGWIYWCKGAFAEQSYDQPGASPLVTKAAHIFRRHADGTGPIENVMTGGMDNPVDVVFMPSGERIFTTTFLQVPGGGLRDGLIHAVYGGVYGKVHNVADFHPRTGDLLPPLVHQGASAPCGLARYESTVFGRDYQDNLFACQFNMHKVSRHQLTRQGATFQSVDSDFVVSSNIDFHPTDVLEDADGSLVVCDTGGWYKLCCPTSQLSKPDILGAVYRVRRKDRSRMTDPRGLKRDWNRPGLEELISRLSDPRPAVQNRAVQELAKRRQAAVPALVQAITKPAVADLRCTVVWTLTRIDDPRAREAIRNAAADTDHVDTDQNVRLAALHSISLWRDKEAAVVLRKCLQDPSASIRRAAAEAIGRIGSDVETDLLVNAALPDAGSSRDRVLEHSVTFAMIELKRIGASQAFNPQNAHSIDPVKLRVQLVAADQVPGSKLRPEHVVWMLSSDKALLKETALWIVDRHPEWGDSLAEYLRDRLDHDLLVKSEQDEMTTLLARFAGSASVQQLLAVRIQAVPATQANRIVRQLCLTAMARSGLKQMPSSWVAALAQNLVDANAEAATITSVINVVRSAPIPKGGIGELTEALKSVIQLPSSPADVRVEAMAALPAGESIGDFNQFPILIQSLSEDASVPTRSAAVEAILKLKLTTEQQGMLADAIPRVGPLELNRLLGAFESSSDDAVGRILVDALRKSPVLTSLRVDSVKQRLAKFPPSVQAAAEDLYTAINVEAGRQKERLDQISETLGTGDVRRGQLVFQTSKAACSACHAIGYLGGTIGPDLSRIGKIRTERDLLESVLFPSVSFVRSYEPVLIVMKSGKQYSGLIRRETSDEITLAIGAREEARIARSDIEEMRPGTVSIMPAGLDTQLTQQQLADLIAFLKSRQ